MNNLHKVTRFEVIDSEGRKYVKHNVKIDLSFQDDDKTLKVFVTTKEEASFEHDWQQDEHLNQ